MIISKTSKMFPDISATVKRGMHIQQIQDVFIFILKMFIENCSRT